MNSCGALCCFENARYFLVGHSLLHSHRENISLHRREIVHRPPHTRRCFLGNHAIECVVRRLRIRCFDWHDIVLPLLRPPPVEHQSALDREKPGPKRALATKRVQRGECPHERVLHQLLDFLPLPCACRKAGERVCMALHELGCRSRIARLPPLDQCRVGFVGAPV